MFNLSDIFQRRADSTCRRYVTARKLTAKIKRNRLPVSLRQPSITTTTTTTTTTSRSVISYAVPANDANVIIAERILRFFPRRRRAKNDIRFAVVRKQRLTPAFARGVVVVR